jgi:hypothetical protein
LERGRWREEIMMGIMQGMGDEGKKRIMER